MSYYIVFTVSNVIIKSERWTFIILPIRQQGSFEEYCKRNRKRKSNIFFEKFCKFMSHWDEHASSTKKEVNKKKESKNFSLTNESKRLQ